MNQLTKCEVSGKKDKKLIQNIVSMRQPHSCENVEIN